MRLTFATSPVLSDGAAAYTPGFAEKRGGVSKFAASDYLGTHSKMLNSAGAVTSTRQYDAFGLPLSGSDPSPFGFAGSWGYREDHGDLKLLGHRHYDPYTGRFLTRDPIKDGRNWYAYCANNPVAAVDPTGLVFETALDILGLIYDVYEFARDPSLINGLYLLWSGTSIVFPGMPGSWVARAAKAGAKSVGLRGAALQKVLRDGFRARLLALAGLKASNLVAHHIIPVALSGRILDKFGKSFPGGEGALIEFLRNASNGMLVDKAKHAAKSRLYHKLLEEWLAKNPNGKLSELYDFAEATSKHLFK